MNYKILAISAVIGVGVITISLMEAQTPARQREMVERMSAVNIEAPQAEYGFAEAMSSDYPSVARQASYSAEPLAP